MSPCAVCSKKTDVGAVNPKKCAKCRNIVYCSEDCQKTDWENHKKICKPCAIYIQGRFWDAFASKQWRKVIKLHSYIEEHVFGWMRLRDDPDHNEQTSKIHYALVAAYKMGISSTGDPENVYANAVVPVLKELAELMRKAKLFSEQGMALCELGHMTNRILGNGNKTSVKYYEKARVIALRHGDYRLKAVSCLALGVSARDEDRQFEAAAFFRTAVAAAAHDNSASELGCCSQLIDALLELNSIDEAETFIQRLSRIIQRVPGSDLKGPASVYQLSYHQQSARVLEARGNFLKAEREVRKMIELIHANESDVRKFRTTFLHILEVANKKLKVLDPETGNKNLVKSMSELACVRAIL